MVSLVTIGRTMAGAGFIGLVFVQNHAKTYLIGRPVLPSWIHAEQSAYLTIPFTVIVAGMAVSNKQTGRWFAFLTGLYILAISFLLCHVPDMMHKNAEGILWQLNAYKTLALAGGCWIIAASFSGKPVWLSNKMLLITGWVTMALWLLIAGVSHIRFNSFVQDFIPAYIPARAFWSYFTAVALLAGGVGLLINPLRRRAALLSGVMILLWFFLLHIPRTLANPGDTNEWLGVCESFIFSGMLFVLAALSPKKTM